MGYNIPMRKQNIMSVREFYSEYAPTEEKAIERFEAMRWSDGVECPHCESKRIAKVENQKQPYRCKDCRKRFTEKTNTIMQASKISMQCWLYAIYLMSVSKKGISSLQMSRELGITQKSAWYMLQKIRECYEFNFMLGNEVEADETYIGGKEKNKHTNKKGEDKTIVAGLRDRDGIVTGQVVEDVSADTLEINILQKVEKNATIYTDEHGGYIGLKSYGYKHKTINHSAKQYADGNVCTNGIESYWALLKRGHYGTFHNLSKKHLQRYVNEFSYRLNMKYASTVQYINNTCFNGLGRVRTFNDIRG